MERGWGDFILRCDSPSLEHFIQPVPFPVVKAGFKSVPGLTELHTPLLSVDVHLHHDERSHPEAAVFRTRHARPSGDFPLQGRGDQVHVDTRGDVKLDQ